MFEFTYNIDSAETRAEFLERYYAEDNFSVTYDDAITTVTVSRGVPALSVFRRIAREERLFSADTMALAALALSSYDFEGDVEMVFTGYGVAISGTTAEKKINISFNFNGGRWQHYNFSMNIEENSLPEFP